MYKDWMLVDVLDPSVEIRTRPSAPTSTPSGLAGRLTVLQYLRRIQIDHAETGAGIVADVETASIHGDGGGDRRRSHPDRVGQELVGIIVYIHGAGIGVHQIQAAAGFVEHDVRRGSAEPYHIAESGSGGLRAAHPGRRKKTNG